MDRYIRIPNSKDWELIREEYDFVTKKTLVNKVKEAEILVKIDFKVILDLSEIKPDIVGFGYYPLREKYQDNEKKYEFRVYFKDPITKKTEMKAFKSDFKGLNSQQKAQLYLKERYGQNLDIGNKEIRSEDFMAMF